MRETTTKNEAKKKKKKNVSTFIRPMQINKLAEK